MEPLVQRRGAHFFDVSAEAVPVKAKGPAAAGLPVNTRLKAALEMGISSSKTDGVVLARVLAPVLVGDKVVVPKGALLRGKASSDNERMYLQFSELLIGDQKLTLTGSAIEGEYAGLLAQKRQASLEEQQKAALAAGALGAAADVALQLTTGVQASALQDTTGGAVQATQQAQKVDPKVVLVVPAKTPFEVVITE